MTIRLDNRLADAPMVPVACRRCGVNVLARKGSWNQTSVQWKAQVSTQCLERREADKLTAHGHKLFLGCAVLAESIVAAVRAGDLAIVDETQTATPPPATSSL
jgi:hypothetical protein